MIRDIVRIDEEKCDGCGFCVPSCAEGAIKIINGKARLIRDNLCDGLGTCLGHCPRGAITIEKRDAEAFDEEAVKAAAHPSPISTTQHADGCPGSRFAQFDAGKPGVFGAARASGGAGSVGQPSALSHWPVQLRLLSPEAPVLRGARLLVAADCVPFACADFHRQLLAGRAVVVACPKLDDPRGYLEKLTTMVRHNDLKELVVAHMEVPCCTGILQMVLHARDAAQSQLPVEAIQVGIHGQIIGRRQFLPNVSINPAACPTAAAKGER